MDACSDAVNSLSLAIDACVEWQDSVSRGRDRASVRKCPEQWGISKFANGKEPTGLFARKHLLTPEEELKMW